MTHTNPIVLTKPYLYVDDSNDNNSGIYRDNLSFFKEIYSRKKPKAHVLECNIALRKSNYSRSGYHIEIIGKWFLSKFMIRHIQENFGNIKFASKHFKSTDIRHELPADYHCLYPNLQDTSILENSEVSFLTREKQHQPETHKNESNNIFLGTPPRTFHLTPPIIRPNPNFNQQRPSAIQQNPNFNKFSSQRTHHLNTRNPSADNYTDNYQEYQYSTNDNYTDDYQDSQNFGAESYTDNYQEHQSNISDHTNDQYDFGYSETQLNQYENFQDFPIGPISFDPPINQSIDPTSELQAQVQALNISDNLNPNLNFPEQMFL
ncbi:hypothetical protein JTB14_011116 [Gonioctena quinquepunctata]|nr:hypothetical protein JTB14_011116 [Gonioctena quinquepunctata]